MGKRINRNVCRYVNIFILKKRAKSVLMKILYQIWAIAANILHLVSFSYNYQSQSDGRAKGNQKERTYWSEARPPNHSWQGKAKFIAYSACVCVSVAIIILHVKRMRRVHCHLWPVRLYHIIPHYVIKGKILERNPSGSNTLFNPHYVIKGKILERNPSGSTTLFNPHYVKKGRILERNPSGSTTLFNPNYVIKVTILERNLPNVKYVF